MAKKKNQVPTEEVTVTAPLTREQREDARRELSTRRAALNAQLAELDKEEERIKQDELNEKRAEARKKIEFLRENREFVLGLFEHERTSCSDEHPVNGYGYSAGHARCNKCFLMEILNGEWGDDWKIEFNIDITPIE